MPFIESAVTAIEALPKIKTRNITPGEAEKAAEAIAELVRKTPTAVINMLVDGYGLVRRLGHGQEDKPLPLSDPRTLTAFKAIFRYLKEADPRVPSQIIKNQIMSPGVLRGDVMYGDHRRREMEHQLGIKIPWAMILNVTPDCNIQPPCNGCFAAKHFGGKGLSPDELDRLTGEAEDLGISATVFSGGEPLIREADILKVARRHPRQNYAVFTNGVLIREDTAKRFLETGATTVFFIHLQGDRESTEKFMGSKVYERSRQGMKYLREAHFPFGFSITVNRENFDQVTNNKYTNDLREAGCRFGIFFPYIPVGEKPDPELMLTADQDKRLKEVAVRMRRKEVLVFSPEDLMSNNSGCIAGTGYIAVTASGEIEPCVFMHASDTNVRDVPLAEALVTSALIRGCQDAQESERTCLIRQRPEVLAGIIRDSRAVSTDT